MAITEDASTPAVATGTGAGPITTASFSPPANSLLTVVVGGGWSNLSGGLTVAITDSGGHTWNVGVTATGDTVNDYGGVAAVAYLYLTAAPGSMTVTATYSNFGTGGGNYCAVRVLNGAKASQTGAATATKIVPTAGSTDGTVSIITTVTGSLVYGAVDNPFSNAAYTPNGVTTKISEYQDATDGITLLSWVAASATGTPGATSLGGTWATAQPVNIAAFEVLPASGAVAAIPNKQLILPQAINRSYFF